MSSRLMSIEASLICVSRSPSIFFLSALVSFLISRVDLPRISEKLFQFADGLLDIAVLVLDLLALQRRQASQLHVEDRLRLLLV